jgi:hypothetical protein
LLWLVRYSIRRWDAPGSWIHGTCGRNHDEYEVALSKEGMQDGNMMRALIRISWSLFAVRAPACSSVLVLHISMSAPQILDSGKPCNKIDGGFERKPVRCLASKIATYKFFTTNPQGDIMLSPTSTCAKRLLLTIGHVQFVHPKLILFS